MSDVRRTLAADLLEIGAVLLRPNAPFTWASGIASPIYCDNRLTLAYPEVRRRIRDAFAAVLEREGLRPDSIAGTATAGIPHAAWLADLLDLPMLYVRSKPKGHGRGNQIEGRLQAGDRVVLVEDLVSTGGSSIDAVRALRDAGAEVIAVIAIFTYGLDKAARAFEETAVPLFTLSDYNALLAEAEAKGKVSASDLETLRAWRVAPEQWERAGGGNGGE